MAKVETEVEERPILFSGAMVQAILEGRKTQTRRVVKPLPSWQVHSVCDPSGAADPWAVWFHYPSTERVGHLRYCPYGKPGDRLWVREACYIAPPNWTDSPANPRGPKMQEVGYAATSGTKQAAEDYKLKLTPSIHMPRWASRITLEIKSVRVERIQDISGHDCLDEGIPPQGGNSSDGEFRLQAKFRELWDSINAKRGYDWDKNPWVWVIEFERA